MRALVIAHDPFGPASQIEERLVQRGFDVDTHLVAADPDLPNDAAPFPDVSGYDILVPMGSKESLTRKHEIDTWIHDEIRLVRDCHEAGMPILGVCFGGQIIAEALGGAVEVAPVTELGWFEIEDGPDHTNPVGRGPWMEWHHDRLIPPPHADVLAENANAVQLIRIGTSVGTQFHPEVDVAHIVGFLDVAQPEYLAEYGTDRHKLLADITAHEARNVKQCHALVDWFLDAVAFPSELPVSTTT